MILARSGIHRLEMIRIAEPIDTLMVVAHDVGDFAVVIDVAKNPFADHRMLFHLRRSSKVNAPGFSNRPAARPILPTS